MTEPGKVLFGVRSDSFGHLPLSDLFVRFGFGAVISAIAGVVSVLAGSEPGSILLAFPAILPATLTLIEKERTNGRPKTSTSGRYSVPPHSHPSR